MRTVIVLGGGATVRMYDIWDLDRRGTVIGVNDSAIHARCAVAVTMDRLWFENRCFHPALRHAPVYYREGIAKNVEPPSHAVPFKCNNKPGPMSDEPNTLNGNNSGMCALNLAYQMRPHRVYLLGFDMCRAGTASPYWYDPYPWAPHGGTKEGKYAQWAEDFRDIARQFREIGVQVFNVSHRSALTAFPIIPYEHFRQETTQV